MAELPIDENERREYFRIYDAIALEIEPINKEAVDAAKSHFSEARRRFVAEPNIAPDEYRLEALLGRLQRDYPELVAYLRDLETRLEYLSNALGDSLPGHQASSTHKVNISGNGISFGSDRPLMNGDVVIAKMELFPKHTRIMAIAEAVSCQEVDGRSLSGKFATGAKFIHIEEQDREVLLKHIHEVQMKLLQVHRGSTPSA